MLVLQRKRDEAAIITVGDVRIRVVVVALRGDAVRLGFEGPMEATINREELQRIIDAGEPPRRPGRDGP